jgi:hypothetical protein
VRRFNELEIAVPNIKILVVSTKTVWVNSFYIDDLHFNLSVKMLNDRFEYKTRGGRSLWVPMDTFIARRPRNL